MDTAFRPFWCDDDPVHRSLLVLPSNLRLQSCPDVAIKSHSMFKATSCIIPAARFVCACECVCVVTEAGKSWAGFDRLIVCIICNRCSRGANVPFWLAPASFFGSSCAPKGFACCWWHRSMLVGQFCVCMCVCVWFRVRPYTPERIYSILKRMKFTIPLTPLCRPLRKWWKSSEISKKTGMLYLYVRVAKKERKFVCDTGSSRIFVCTL